MKECPNHNGGFDCTPFCPLCEGNQEIGRDRIAPHYGHEIVVAQYTGEDGRAVNFAVECMDCYEVLFDEERGAN